MKTGELCRRRDTAGRVVLSRLTSLITNKMLTFIMEEMNLSLSLSLPKGRANTDFLPRSLSLKNPIGDF